MPYCLHTKRLDVVDDDRRRLEQRLNPGETLAAYERYHVIVTNVENRYIHSTFILDAYFVLADETPKPIVWVREEKDWTTINLGGIGHYVRQTYREDCADGPTIDEFLVTRGEIFAELRERYACAVRRSTVLDNT